ncbi:hypothetical protein SLS55_008649 [Diplodia seriata]|uniref:Myb-like domain-containing protein n=2 Tax=Diplodia TaxID=66735 RepID=A0ABR3C6J5_9PEZI
MSSSPHHPKRSLKPNPMSASPSQLTVSGGPAGGHFNPASATTADPFSGTPYAVAPPVGGTSSASTTSPTSPTNPRKRRASGASAAQHHQIAPNATIAPSSVTAGAGGTSSAYGADPSGLGGGENEPQQPVQPPPPKKGRTNTPWTAAEEQRLKIMRDAGNSWSEIAKVW